MDALFFFRHSDHEDAELRYALRGIAKHAPWIRKVWIFGDRPEFLSSDRSLIEHVPHEYVARIGKYRTPVTNFFLMFYLAYHIPELDPEILWFCDDFMIIDDLSPEEARRDRYVENMDNVTNRGTGLWKESLWRTYDFLKLLGYTGYNFEAHAPTYFTRKRIFEAWCDFQDYVTEDRWFGMLGPSAILNHAVLRGPVDLVSRAEEGKWVGYHGSAPDLETVRRETTGKVFLNFDDAAFNDGIQRFLEERFPERCCYESDEFSGSQDTAGFEAVLTSATRDALETDKPQDRRIYPQVILKSRNEFPEWLNQRGLTGEGAEIGVLRGEFSVNLLRHWRGRKLHCVDPWREARAEPRYFDKNNQRQHVHDHHYAETLRRLSSFGDRIHIHRLSPQDAATGIADRSLDFVYLDYRHYREALLDHLQIWSRKVKPGGVLAGHDYLDGVLPSGHFEVKSTVDEWAAQHGLMVACTGEPVWRSWIIHLP